MRTLQEIEFNLRFELGRYDALREAQRYAEQEAANSFMSFTDEGDVRAKELRSLAAMFGRWADAADSVADKFREERRQFPATAGASAEASV